MSIAREPGPGRLIETGARLRGFAWTAGITLAVMLVLGTVIRLSGSRPVPSAESRQSQRSPVKQAAGGRFKPAPFASARNAARVEIIERQLRGPRRALAALAPAERPSLASDDPADKPEMAADKKQPLDAQPSKLQPAAPVVVAGKSAATLLKPEAPRAGPAAVPSPPAVKGVESPAEPDTPAEPEERPEATYPREAAAEGVTGTVRLKVVVAHDGQVEDALVVRSSGDERLDQAAETAVRQWRYRPAQRQGRPVRATDYVEVEFYRDSIEPVEE